jgi:hypothetical protein
LTCRRADQGAARAAAAAAADEWAALGRWAARAAKEEGERPEGASMCLNQPFNA